MGAMVKRIGSGRRAKGMRAKAGDIDLRASAIAGQKFVDSAPCYSRSTASDIVTDRANSALFPSVPRSAGFR